jgi:pyroglutamyl-peptidase
MHGRLLVTGFGPFGSVTDNPSARLAEGCGELYRILPVEFEACDRFALQPVSPPIDTVLLMGVAVSRRILTLEMVAWNRIRPTPDAAGNVRRGLVWPESDPWRAGNLWTPEVLSAVLRPGLAVMGYCPGTYLCNYLYYRMRAAQPRLRVGFLHVPPFEHLARTEQAAWLQDLMQALRS